MAPTMKLVYFDAKGVVEKTRYMLAAAGAEYEDFRYEIAFGTPGDYSTLQRRRPAPGNDRPRGPIQGSRPTSQRVASDPRGL